MHGDTVPVAWLVVELSAPDGINPTSVATNVTFVSFHAMSLFMDMGCVYMSFHAMFCA